MSRFRQNIVGLLISIMCALPASLFSGPIVQPGAKLSTFETRYFDIIFTPASRDTALYLSSFADDLCDKVSARLEIPIKSRIPVVITSDVGIFNGFTDAAGFTQIVLYDSALDPSFTSYRDNIKSLFLHELVHAITFHIGSPNLGNNLLSFVFISMLTEGIAVSMEGEDIPHMGRDKDPLTRQFMLEDVFENKFRNPMEAQGTEDDYIYGGIAYTYGGLFSRYLIDTYGQEKFNDFWYKMARLNVAPTFDYYSQGAFKAFADAYGNKFLDEWQTFRSSFLRSDIKKSTDIVWPATKAQGGGFPLEGFATNERYLYWVDGMRRAAFEIEARATKPAQARKLFSADNGTDISDATSANDPEPRLLVHRYSYSADYRERGFTIVYNIKKRQFVEATKTIDMHSARFFREGWIGIKQNLHNSNLVYKTAKSEDILLAGSERLTFSSPAVLDATRIALIVVADGQRSIGIYNVDTHALGLFSAQEQGLFDFVRHIDTSDGKIYFNYNRDYSMYKLGVIDKDTARLDTTNYSGGVMYPRVSQGNVYYIANFSDSQNICRFPENADSAGTQSLALNFAAFDVSPFALARQSIISQAAVNAHEAPYNQLKYSIPDFYPSVDPDAIPYSFRPLLNYIFRDPTYDNQVIAQIGYDFVYPFAEANLTWNNFALGPVLSAQIADALSYDSKGNVTRAVTGITGAKVQQYLYPSDTSIIAGIMGGIGWSFYDNNHFPYIWPQRRTDLFGSTWIGYNGKVSGHEAFSYNGINVTSYNTGHFSPNIYLTELEISASTDFLRPMTLELWGTWSTDAISSLSADSYYFMSVYRPSYYEYGSLESVQNTFQDYLAQGAYNFRIVTIDAQGQLWFMYSRKIMWSIGARGAWFDSTLWSSAYTRFEWNLLVPFGLFRLESTPFFEVFYRFNSLPDVKPVWFRFGIEIPLSPQTVFARPSNSYR